MRKKTRTVEVPIPNKPEPPTPEPIWKATLKPQECPQCDNEDLAHFEILNGPGYVATCHRCSIAILYSEKDCTHCGSEEHLSSMCPGGEL